MKKDAQYFYAEGVWRYEKGLKSAVKYFEKARELAEKDENNSYIFNRRAYIKLEIKDYDGAIQDFEKSLEFFPFKWLIYEHIANSYVKKGEKEKAYQYLDGAISKFSDNIDFQLKLWNIKIHMANNNNDSELALKDAQALIDNKEISDVDKHFAYVFKAYELWKAGKYEEAIEILDFCISFNPEYVKNYYDKALLLCNVRQYGLAKEVFEIADKLYRNESNQEPNIYTFQKGFCYEEANQYVLALKFYNKSIKNNEGCQPYQYKIGILTVAGKPYLALKWCERAEKLYKKELDMSFYGNKGLALFFIGDYKNAIKNLKKYPEYKEGKVLIAYCRYLLGDKVKALKEIENIYNKEKIDVALYCLATIYTTKNEFDKALETCDKIQKQDADTDIIRAYIYKKMGDLSNSEKYLNLAVENDERKRTKEQLIKEFEYTSQVKFDKM